MPLLLYKKPAIDPIRLSCQPSQPTSSAVIFALCLHVRASRRSLGPLRAAASPTTPLTLLAKLTPHRCHSVQATVSSSLIAWLGPFSLRGFWGVLLLSFPDLDNVDVSRGIHPHLSPPTPRDYIHSGGLSYNTLRTFTGLPLGLTSDLTALVRFLIHISDSTGRLSLHVPNLSSWWHHHPPYQLTH